MKNVIIIFCLLTAASTKAQTYYDYNKVPELKIPQSLSVFQIAGTFEVEGGFERLILKLDKSGSFNEDYNGCTDHVSISGTWMLIGKKIVLKDSLGSRMYDVLQFRQYYILVLSEQKVDFIKQFKGAVKNTKADNDADFVQYIIEKLPVLIYSRKM